MSNSLGHTVPVDRLMPNFEGAKICTFGGLFAKAVCKNKMVNLGEKWLSWVRMYYIEDSWSVVCFLLLRALCFEFRKTS